eukprot:3186941-Rhodomonas_salina.1
MRSSLSWSSAGRLTICTFSLPHRHTPALTHAFSSHPSILSPCALAVQSSPAACEGVCGGCELDRRGDVVGGGA